MCVRFPEAHVRIVLTKNSPPNSRFVFLGLLESITTRRRRIFCICWVLILLISTVYIISLCGHNSNGRVTDTFSLFFFIQILTFSRPFFLASNCRIFVPFVLAFISIYCIQRMFALQCLKLQYEHYLLAVNLKLYR